ncbi:myb-like protein X [Hydractinia symbiolongicarpus]|uniref:myb-like protein X n=1 Tax=Hydractinia symbiolongicarpus TaxID=13093 RepID=UPI00254EBC3C|nr:myb-like protein X [Hydractinia symbiolongicarpus]
MLGHFFIIVLFTGTILTAEHVKKSEKDIFGGGESFLKTKVHKPNVPHGSGSVHEVSKKVNITHEDEEKLRKILLQVYKNFINKNEKQVIHSDKKERYHEKSFDDIDVMRKTVSTAAPKIAFGELKDTINKLLYELSRDNNKEYKNAESEERKKYPKFSEIPEDDRLSNIGEENSVDVNLIDENSNSKEKVNAGFKQFKNKFYETFFKRSQIDKQSIVFNGKKKKKNDRENSKSDSLNELYEELKKEVQEEKKAIARKNVFEERKEIEKKKKDIISSLRKLFTNDHRENNQQTKEDEDFERIYNNNNNYDIDSRKKSVDQESNGGVSTGEGGMPPPFAASVGSKTARELRREKLRKYLTNFIGSLDHQVPDQWKTSNEKKARRFEDELQSVVSKKERETSEESSKDTITVKSSESKRKEKREKLRKYLISFIRDLNARDDSEVDKSKRFENELENIVVKGKAQKKKKTSEISEALKGFEFKRDVDSYTRP